MQFSNPSNISSIVQDMVRTYNNQMINSTYQQYRKAQPSIPADQSLTYKNTTEDIINREIINIIYRLIQKIQQEQNNTSMNTGEETVPQEEIALPNEQNLTHTSTDLLI